MKKLAIVAALVLSLNFSQANANAENYSTDKIIPVYSENVEISFKASNQDRERVRQEREAERNVERARWEMQQRVEWERQRQQREQWERERQQREQWERERKQREQWERDRQRYEREQREVERRERERKQQEYERQQRERQQREIERRERERQRNQNRWDDDRKYPLPPPNSNRY